MADDVPVNSRILDFGCGEGNYLLQFCGLKRYYGIGVDISKESLRKAIQSAKERKLRRQVDFVRANVNYLPFRDEAFDGSFVINVFHHVSGFLSVRQLYKSVKNGGCLLIIDSAGTNPFKFLVRKVARLVGTTMLGYGKTVFFSPTTLKHAVSQAGFRIVKEDFKEFFLEYLALLFLFPPFANFISNKTLLALNRIEEKLGNLQFLN